VACDVLAAPSKRLVSSREQHHRAGLRGAVHAHALFERGEPVDRLESCSRRSASMWARSRFGFRSRAQPSLTEPAA
jgi:hypothetical protein